MTIVRALYSLHTQKENSEQRWKLVCRHVIEKKLLQKCVTMHLNVSLHFHVNQFFKYMSLFPVLSTSFALSYLSLFYIFTVIFSGLL